MLLGFAQCGGNALFVFRGNRDDIDAERDPIFDDFILFGRITVGGAIKESLKTQFLGRAVGAMFARDEVRVALGFRHHGNHELSLGGKHSWQTS